MKEKNGFYMSSSLSLSTIGFITWIVFLVLKLCNQSNPDFEWLTWFWVWFPLWAPMVLDFLIGVVVFIIIIRHD